MPGKRASAALASLAHVCRHYAPGLAARKLTLLESLSRSTLGSARQVLRFHELLCFLDAYPDDRRVHALVRRMLRQFGRRRDLLRFRAALAGTGIAGTDTPYRFYWPTVRWISECWPGSLVFDAMDPGHARAILAALPLLLEPAQADFLRKQAPRTVDVLDRLRPRGMTDADYFIGLVAAMPGDESTREAFFDGVDPPLVLRTGRGTPERTTPRFDWLKPRYRAGPLKGERPDLRRERWRAPRRVTRLIRARADALIALARVSMVTRERDLEVFEYANRADAFLIDDGGGLGFAMVGMLPERRALLPAIYGGLILQNGVAIGYVQLDILGRHAELSFNLFESFRGGESGRLFARLVAATHHVFGCDGFSIEPYQLGDGNEEGIESGAWWFYHRFGFRPRAAAARRIAAREQRRVVKYARYRSSSRTLLELAKSHLYYSLAKRREAKLPRVRAVLECAARELRRFPQATVAERRAAAMAAAIKRLGIRRSYRPAPAAQRMLQRWAGLVLALTARGGWNAAERRALLRLIEAKAGAEERSYLRRLARHRLLRRILDC